MFIEINWMRKGHGPGGIIGTTEKPQTMATWVLSMDATMTMTGVLKKMSGSEEVVQMTTRKNRQVASFGIETIVSHCAEHCCHALIAWIQIPM